MRQCTPAEFRELCAGYLWRQEREWDRIAYLASTILATVPRKSGHEPTTVKTLLGRKLWESHAPGYERGL